MHAHSLVRGNEPNTTDSQHPIYFDRHLPWHDEMFIRKRRKHGIKAACREFRAQLVSVANDIDPLVSNDIEYRNQIIRKHCRSQQSASRSTTDIEYVAEFVARYPFKETALELWNWHNGLCHFGQQITGRRSVDPLNLKSRVIRKGTVSVERLNVQFG